MPTIKAQNSCFTAERNPGHRAWEATDGVTGALFDLLAADPVWELFIGWQAHWFLDFNIGPEHPAITPKQHMTQNKRYGESELHNETGQRLYDWTSVITCHDRFPFLSVELQCYLLSPQVQFQIRQITLKNPN